MRVIVIALLVALAGCASEPVATVPDDPSAPPDVVTSATEGAISGVVVDRTIAPIANATVKLHTGETTQVAGDGSFSFLNLDPAIYFLNVSAPGYLPQQTSADVKADEVSKIRVLLEPTLSQEPAWQTLKHDGYIEFSGGLSGPLLNIILVGVLGENPTCDCTLDFNTEGMVLETIVVEAVWTDSFSNPQGASELYLEVFPAELDDGTADIQGGFIPSPIHRHYPYEVWDENRDENNVDWSARLSGDAYTIQVQQKYELFVTTFVNADAPEGWSAISE